MCKYKVIDKHSVFTNIINTSLYTHYEKISKEETHSKRVSELCEILGEAMELP